MPWREKWVWVIGLSGIVPSLLGGCSSTACEDAVQKLTGECSFGQGASLQGGPVVECKDSAECRAECILDASCDEIVSEDGDTEYATCLALCANQEAQS
ncbi:MAG: hypothetical protein AAGA56_22310 [Myxococcota bacterium]